jgi:hypothetical protein
MPASTEANEYVQSGKSSFGLQQRDAILRDAGGLQGLAVQLGQGDPNAFEPEQPIRTCQAIADTEAAASEPGLSPI